MNKLIPPTIGRVVWYTPWVSDHRLARLNDQPLAALVVGVHSDRVVNLIAYDAIGNPAPQIAVTLLQEDDVASPDGNYAQWMPYQLGQAAKAEPTTENDKIPEIPTLTDVVTSVENAVTSAAESVVATAEAAVAAVEAAV